MNDLTESARVSRAINAGQSGGSQRTAIGAGGKEPPRPYGAQIAQTALQSVGMSTRDGWSPHMRPPDYALAVSLIFTKATNQAIILREPPSHVCSTSILWNSLAHDKRFEQVPMSEAAPGDIIIGSGWQQGADGYAGIVVDHGRIISNSSQGVRDNSSLVEIQRSHLAAFRYVGFRNYYRGKALANAGFDPNEPRLPAGQPGGGQWTTGGAGGFQQTPSTLGLSGILPRINSVRPPQSPKKRDPSPLKDAAAERMMQIDPPIASDPISEALDLLSLASISSLLKSIPSLVAVSAKGLGALLRKLAAVAVGKAVNFTEEESELLAKILSRIKKTPSQSQKIVPEEITPAVENPSAASVSDKLQRYTLNPDHPRGGNKAQWFDQALGYTRKNADGLAKQLVFDESKAVQTAVTPYGTKFSQIINVVGANARIIPVKTIWIRGEDGVTRLVTAVPGD
jgi:hypothetical protein